MYGICLPRCSGKCFPHSLLRWLDWVWGFHHSPYNSWVQPLIPSGALCLHKSIWHYLALASSRPWAGTRTGWNLQHPLLWVSLSLPPSRGRRGWRKRGVPVPSHQLLWILPGPVMPPTYCSAIYTQLLLGEGLLHSWMLSWGGRSLWSRARRHGEGKHIGVIEIETEKEISWIADPR